MKNPFSLYVGSLKSALQGDITGAQALYEEAEVLKSEQELSFSESVHPDLPYLEQALTTLLSSYDFTRCVRPDGSVYGSRGKCRKGTEAGPAKEGMIGEATPAQRAAAENKAAQMRNRNSQADRAALTRKVAKELGEDIRSVKVAKEVERRQQEAKQKDPKTVRANVDKLRTETLKAKQALQSAKESKSPEDIRKARAEFNSLKNKLTSSLEEAKKTGTILW